MIYVFRENPSQGARLLAEALNGRKVRALTRIADLRITDRIIAWGESLGATQFRGTLVLNGNAPIRNKFTDAELLREAGVRTIEVSEDRPRPAAQAVPTDPAIALLRRAVELADDFVDAGEELLGATTIVIPRTQVYRDGVQELVQAITNFNAAVRQAAPVAPPAQPVGDWLPRLSNHVGGADLLRPPADPDYYVKKEEFVNEYRIHSFLGRSLRGGKKVVRDDFDVPGGIIQGRPKAHPWVRSWDGGWRIKYDGETVKQKHRDIAHAAVRALGLDFGAVDIGEKADGTLVVLEVNRAPGIEGGTVEKYRDAINRWISGEWTAANAPAANRENRTRTTAARR